MGILKGQMWSHGEITIKFSFSIQHGQRKGKPSL